MAESAAQTQYRQEIIATFEEGMSWLRQTTVTETVIKGNSAVFLVAGSGGATANTRGINGLIPARADDMTQNTATLVEWHDLVRKTRFNIFQSQGDQRRLMQTTTRKVLNRRFDADIVAQLDTATNQVAATAAIITLQHVMKALTTLGENEVPVEDEDSMWAVATPGVRGYLSQMTEFNSADYVDTKPLVGPVRRVKRWAGFNWIFHPNLTGVGTASEKCYFFHRDAMGSAFDTDGMNTAIGYDDEQDYSYARASAFTAAKLLQQAGIVQFLHDASGI